MKLSLPVLIVFFFTVPHTCAMMPGKIKSLAKNKKFLVASPSWTQPRSRHVSNNAQRDDITDVEKKQLAYYLYLSSINTMIGPKVMRSLGLDQHPQVSACSKNDAAKAENQEELLWKLEDELFTCLSAGK